MMALKNKARFLLLSATLLLAVAMSARAQFNYTTLSVPGSTFNVAQATDGTNVLVECGPFENSNFLYNIKNGTYTMLNLPIMPQGISGNYIVGGNWLYDLNSRTHITLSVPGEYEGFLQIYAISGNEVVGSYFDYAAEGWQGFLYDINRQTYTTFGVPNAPDTFAQGVSGTNIVGYTDYNAFLYNGSSYTALFVPGAQGASIGKGISDNNIVGYYSYKDYSGGEISKGFLYNIDSQTYTSLSVPLDALNNATVTCAEGISGNYIVGYYQTASSTYAFLATKPPVFSSLTLTNGHYILSGTNGMPSVSYRLLTSTNFSLPLSCWSAIATNSFDSYGNFSLTKVVDGLTNQDQYFEIASP